MTEVRAGGYRASVVIPAHNESPVINRLLDGLVDGGDLDIVVVCNGCSDDTAARSRAYGLPVRVIETPIPSKAKALRLGDTGTDVFPRFYVDADVELTRGDVLAMAALLEDASVNAVAPTRLLPMEGVGPVVRQYYRAWQQLPGVNRGLWGRGVVGLSRAGHQRIADMPELTSDDLAIALHFRPDESRVCSDARVVVRPPRTLRALLARRRRSVAGNAQLRDTSLSADAFRTRPTDLDRKSVV